MCLIGMNYYIIIILDVIIIYSRYAAAAAAAAKSLQSCPTLCNPKMAANQAPSTLGFSRQEHWSGLPFPSPLHEGEK